MQVPENFKCLVCQGKMEKMPPGMTMEGSGKPTKKTTLVVREADSMTNPIHFVNVHVYYCSSCGNIQSFLLRAPLV